jgi:glycosyltransferase involved in cell wall biosynthesis
MAYLRAELAQRGVESSVADGAPEGAYRQVRERVAREAPRIVYFTSFSFFWPDEQLALIEELARARVKMVLRLPSTGHAAPALRGAFSAVRDAIDAFVALNADTIRELSELGVPAERIAHIPNGVPTEIFRPPTYEERRSARAGIEVSEERLLVGFAGRFVRSKRVDVLVSAIGALGAAERPLLLLAGEPDRTFGQPYEPKKTPHVRPIGKPPDMPRFFHALDAYVTASEVEGMPNAVLEAMASGLPILASDISGHRELVTPGESGWLFRPGDHRELGGRLRKLVELKRRSRPGELGTRSRELLLSRFSAVRMADGYLSLFDRLAST